MYNTQNFLVYLSNGAQHNITAKTLKQAERIAEALVSNINFHTKSNNKVTGVYLYYTAI